MTGTRPGPDLQRVWDILRQHPRSLAVVAMGVLATAAFSPWVFCGAIAPWDFLGVSATAPVFTAQSIAAGNWPTWTSFVAGGLPMTSDTGGELFFPLWWIAGLVDLDLTVNTLAHIQVLFVFGGALGYVALLRARSIDWRWALLAGTAFTFFGGNFAEASHSGAVRGFALVPWVLWSLTIPPRGRPWLRFAVLPAWMWFLATGAYPAFVPTMAMLGAAYLACELFQHRDRVTRRLVVMFAATGTATALIVYGAWSAYLEHDALGLLYRPNPPTIRNRAQTSLSALDAFGLYLDPWALRTDGTVHSWGVGIPILLGLAGVTGVLLKRHASVAVAGVGALALGTLPHVDRVGSLMVDELSFLFPARFVAMDTKSVAALAIFFFSILGWREMLEHRRDRRVAVRLGAFLLLWLLWLAFSVVERDPTPSVRMLVAVVVATVLLAEVATRFPKLPAALLVGVLAVLVVGEGFRMSRTMYHDNGTHAWNVQVPDDYPRDVAAAALDELLTTPPATRPERIPPTVDPAKRAHGTPRDALGFVGLGYNVANYGGFMTTAYWEMVNDPEARERFELEWTPWVLPCSLPDCTDVTELGDPAGWASTSAIYTTRYGQESVDYVVELSAPTVLIENEINFPGWVADDDRVTPLEHDGVFRAWRLEPGTYEFTARYGAPEARRQLLLFVLGLTIWGLAAASWVAADGAVGRLWPKRTPKYADPS